VDRHAKAHAFVSAVDTPELDPEDQHHLARVLRLRPGDEITVGDGTGRWRRCRFGHALEPVGPIELDPPESPGITVAFALVKGDRPEWTVQKLTELGVDRIVPFLAERSVVRWDEAKAAHQRARLTKVARMASMQSRRARLPVIEAVRTFADVANLPDLAIAAPDGGPPSLAHPVLAIGPEGGWSEAEQARGLPSVSLGPTVLRAETAAVVGGALLAALRAGLVTSRCGHRSG
jgi:16S rRNA (uracil1498-N3)-methyltransferase